MNERIEPIVRAWVLTGQVSDTDAQLLKAQYLLDIGAPAGCKPCASVWSDIRQHFFYQFKQADLSAYTMASILRKYLILGSGMLMLPGANSAIVNDGEDNENTTVLTDALAEDILEKYPSYDSLIGINPAWTAAQEQSQEAEQDTEDDDQVDARIEALTEAKEKAEAERDEAETALATLKRELTTTKGQLTKAQNEIAKLKTPDSALVPDPAGADQTGDDSTPNA